ncbi:MAG: deoxyribose-phosphate aldolase [Piscinibacter sp.]
MHSPQRRPQDTARLALSCLDLTSLNDGDDEAAIVRLAERAAAAPGPVAALCVWPRFVPTALAHAPAGVAVAAVANFPDGSTDIERALRDSGEIVAAGAHEVDVVMPWRSLAAGDEASCAALLRAVRRACEGRVLKVILETGELKTPALIARASCIALAEGADFLKTSTGKTPVGATPEAATLMLQAIAADAGAAARVGFKAAGGVRSVADAALYLDRVEAVLGAAALAPARCRIGASALLADIEAVLAGGRHGATASGY